MEDNDLKNLQEELQEGEVSLSDCNFMFLDVSSACTGYSKFKLDFINKKAVLESAGSIWLDPKWSHQEKYSYMFNVVMTYFEVVEQVDYIVHEAYSINPNRKSGVMVVPEMLGSIKTAAWENRTKVSEIHPQTWRSQLDIKGKIIPGKGKSKDFKGPTKEKILEYLDVPETVLSNITKNERQTPSDLYDAIAIGLGWLKKYGFRVDTSNCKFNTHVGVDQVI